MICFIQPTISCCVGPIQSAPKRKYVSKKKLPMLNWAPVTNTQKTIFEVCDSQSIYNNS
jgi:hypothetical protein